MLHYALTIFVSAFLLFQVQPVIAKIILPWFGGSAAVWTTCMLFFQMALLGGYLYSHWSTTRLASKAQSTIHLTALLASLLVLPIAPGDQWKPSGTGNPTFEILALLAATVGFPYLILSTTGPLVQAWYARALPGASPYRLFALSNIGSMFALLGYPVLVEPLLPTRQQAYVWSAAYTVFVLLCGSLAWRSRTLASAAPKQTDVEEPEAPAPGFLQYILWGALSACASTLLLATTTHLTVDVAPIPFLWVLPLSLYLLSFILTFDSSGWYSRTWYLPVTALAIAGMVYGLSAESEIHIPAKVALFASALFICCMTCHGEVAALKPHPRYLTSFYLMISIGGAIGGLFVGFAAPNIFNTYLEFPIAITACAILVLTVHAIDPNSLINRTRNRWGWVVAAAALLALIVILVQHEQKAIKLYRLMARNFYGELATGDWGEPGERDYGRKLTHGVINHGEQYLHPSRSREHTSYFGPNAGIGRAVLSRNRENPQRIGITGLGAGVMLTYARSNDYYRIYEINPLVIDIAKREFTFIKECPAKLDLVLGDARLSLEREQPNNFDVLHMDAFSSDSVPVHLLTREAFLLYFKHLKPDGILVMHISNRYLDLEPVVANAAQALGKHTVFVSDEGDDDTGFYGTDMILIANNKADLDKPLLRTFPQPKTNPKIPLWTDDYSNLFRIIRQ